MYYLINQHINLILGNIPQEFVGQYNWLMERLHQVNVAEDAEYRRNYRNYWAMNIARLPECFYDEYFRLLERNKNNAQIDIQHIARVLYNVAHTFQFSFATKLVHMINRSNPIYDKMVRDFYYLPETTARQEFDIRLNDYLRSYNFLCQEYDRVIHEGILTDSINRFRNEFQPVHFTDVKIIDSLIWVFIILARQGGFRDQMFHHQ